MFITNFQFTIVNLNLDENVQGLKRNKPFPILLSSNEKCIKIVMISVVLFLLEPFKIYFKSFTIIEWHIGYFLI